MKYILSIILLFFISINSISAYNLSKKDVSNLSIFEIEVSKIFDKDIIKAYKLNANLDKLLLKYKKDTKNYALLGYIKVFTSKYIIDYENKLLEQIKLEEEKKKELEIEIKDLNKTYINNLPVLSKETKTISSFTIEPKNDNIYLKNVYLKNIGTLSDMSNLFEKLYLVNIDNNIISEGYVIGDYLYFDIKGDYILEKNKLSNLYVKSIFKDIKNQNQTGELKFELSTPINGLIGTLFGIRATSYSNGNYVSSNVEITNPIVTFVSYTSPIVNTKPDFISSYSNILEFSVNNDSKIKLDIDSFEFSIFGSFINSLDLNSEIILKIKGSNQEFGRAKLSSIQDGNLIINHTGNAFDFISINSQTTYVLEINHIGTPTGTREIRLNNMIIGDGFGWLITNLNDYSNTGLPGKVEYYRY